MSGTERFFGDRGMIVVTSGAPAPAGDYYGFAAVGDVEISTATFVDGYPVTGSINGVTFPTGQYAMRLKSLSLTSGTALLYKN